MSHPICRPQLGASHVNLLQRSHCHNYSSCTVTTGRPSHGLRCTSQKPRWLLNPVEPDKGGIPKHAPHDDRGKSIGLVMCTCKQEARVKWSVKVPVHRYRVLAVKWSVKVPMHRSGCLAWHPATCLPACRLPTSAGLPRAWPNASELQCSPPCRRLLPHPVPLLLSACAPHACTAHWSSKVVTQYSSRYPQVSGGIPCCLNMRLEGVPETPIMGHGKLLSTLKVSLHHGAAT